MKITKWKTLNTELKLTATIFRYLKIKRESPTTNTSSDFDVIQCFNWVNVIALTKDQKVVLIKQYRHGTDQVTVEIPGGAVHPGEDVLLAAQRELLEETGYTSKEWSFIGRVDANPAFMNNHCDTYLALNAEKTHDQDLDPFEEIEVYLRDKKDLAHLVKEGEITHSIVIAALFLFGATVF